MYPAQWQPDHQILGACPSRPQPAIPVYLPGARSLQRLDEQAQCRGLNVLQQNLSLCKHDRQTRNTTGGVAPIDDWRLSHCDIFGILTVSATSTARNVAGGASLELTVP